MVKEFRLLRELNVDLKERQKVAEEDTSWVWVVWDRKGFGHRAEGTKRHLMCVNAWCHESLESSRYQQPTVPRAFIEGASQKQRLLLWRRICYCTPQKKKHKKPEANAMELLEERR